MAYRFTVPRSPPWAKRDIFLFLGQLLSGEPAGLGSEKQVGSAVGSRGEDRKQEKQQGSTELEERLSSAGTELFQDSALGTSG